MNSISLSFFCRSLYNRFIIEVSGKAGKFNFIPFFTTIGSGIGLLSIATLVADCLLLNLTKKRKFYQKLKAPETDNEEEPNGGNGDVEMALNHVKDDANHVKDDVNHRKRPTNDGEEECKKVIENKNLNEVFCYRI